MGSRPRSAASRAPPPELAHELLGFIERLYYARERHLGLGTHSEARLRRFVSIIGGCWATPRLELRSVGLGPQATELLVDELLSQPHASRPWLVQLDQNMLGDHGAAAIARLLCRSDSTIWLSAGANTIGPIGAISIFEALANHNTTLTALDLSSDGSTAERNTFARGLRLAESDAIAEAVAAFAPTPHASNGNDDGAVSAGEDSDASSPRRKEDQDEDEDEEIDVPPRTPPHLHPRPALASLAYMLERSPVLSVLRLSSNALGPEAAADLGNALPHAKSLVELSLPNNGIGPSGTAALALGLPQCATLEVVDLANNDLGDAGAHALGEALANSAGVPIPFPSSADMSSPVSSDDEDHAHARHPSKNKHRTNGSRHASRPASGRASPTGNRSPRVDTIPSSSPAQKLPARLTTLQLASNRIGVEGARALCAVFRSCPHLSILKLAKNQIGDKGAAAIAEVARGASKAIGAPLPLTELVLASNGIGDHGGCALAGALELPAKEGCGARSLSLGTTPLPSSRSGSGRAVNGAPPSAKDKSSRFAPLQLIKLDLSSNELGDTSAEELAKLFTSEGATLQTVALGDNVIGDRGGVALGRSLSSARSLRRLGLSGNPLGEKSGAAIVEGVEYSGLLALGLEGTTVPYSYVVTLNRLLALNVRRWEEARPRRFEHRRRELQATSNELESTRAVLAKRRAELEGLERKMDQLIIQLAVVTEGAEARKRADQKQLVDTERAARESELASTEELSKLKQDRMAWLEMLRNKEATLAAAERAAARAYERFSSVSKTSKVGIVALNVEVEPLREVVKHTAVVLRRADEEAIAAESALLDRRRELMESGVLLPRDPPKPKLFLPKEVAEAEAAAEAAAALHVDFAVPPSSGNGVGLATRKRDSSKTSATTPRRGTRSPDGKGRIRDQVITSKAKLRPSGEGRQSGANLPGNPMPSLRS